MAWQRYLPGHYLLANIVHLWHLNNVFLSEYYPPATSIFSKCLLFHLITNFPLLITVLFPYHHHRTLSCIEPELPHFCYLPTISSTFVTPHPTQLSAQCYQHIIILHTMLHSHIPNALHHAPHHTQDSFTPIFLFPTLQPFPSYRYYILYKSSDKGQPCCSPSSTLNHLDWFPPEMMNFYSRLWQLEHVSSAGSCTVSSTYKVSIYLATSLK